MGCDEGCEDEDDTEVLFPDMTGSELFSFRFSLDLKWISLVRCVQGGPTGLNPGN